MARWLLIQGHRLSTRSRQLETFQLIAGQWLLQATVAGNQEVQQPPFDAGRFNLGLLWPYDESIDLNNPPKA